MHLTLNSTPLRECFTGGEGTARRVPSVIREIYRSYVRLCNLSFFVICPSGQITKTNYKVLGPTRALVTSDDGQTIELRKQVIKSECNSKKQYVVVGTKVDSSDNNEDESRFKQDWQQL